MAESTVERSPRAMSPSPSVHRGRNRLRTGLRYAVRGLAVAGFAGAAWLLSSSTAHAAENDVVPGDHSVFALVGDLMAGTATSQPAWESDGAARTKTASTPTGLVTGLVTLLGDGAGETGQGTVADATSNLLAVVLPRSAPRTQQRQQEPIVQPVRTVRTPASRPVSNEAVVEAVVDAMAPAPVLGTANAGAITHRAGTRRAAGTKTLQKPVGDRVEQPNTQGTHHAPLRPRPAPVTGWGSGAMSSGSGIAQDGGTSAVAPAAHAAGEVAAKRPDAAADVEVRLLLAESPTFSPD
jgi:hypothetical protein